MAVLTSKGRKIFLTVNLYFSILTMGLCVAILGPTLIDITHLISTDIKTVSHIFTIRSAVGLLGAFIGGFLFDKIRKELAMLSIFSFISSISMISIVWIRRMEYIFLCLSINLFSFGVVNIGLNVCCLNLWGKNNGPFYQALHFFFSFGGLMAPLVAVPFLGNYSTPYELSNKSDILSNQIELDSPIYTYQNESFSIPSSTHGVIYAYLCIGILCLLSTILFCVIWFMSPFDSVVKKTSTSDTNNSSLIFMCFLVFCVFILTFSSMGTECGYAQMLATYVTQKPMHLSTTTGSYMTATYWAAFSICRFAAIVIVTKTSPRTMIFLDIILMATGTLTLLFLSVHYEWALWLASLLLGAGVSSFFPASVTWIAKYITITNRIASSFVIACIIGDMVIPNAIGHFITENPEVFLYVNALTCLIMIIVALTLYLVLRKVPDKYMLQNKESNSGIELNG